MLQVIGVVPQVLCLDANTVKYLFLQHFVQQQVTVTMYFIGSQLQLTIISICSVIVDKIIFVFFSHFTVLHFRGDVAKLNRLLIAVSKTAELTQLTGQKVQVIGKCSTNIGRPLNILQFCTFFCYSPHKIAFHKLLFCTATQFIYQHT